MTFEQHYAKRFGRIGEYSEAQICPPFLPSPLVGEGMAGVSTYSVG
jgi:hypothetical protein